jgi:RNA polymerase sigma-70 factor (ECF subfamily)
MTASQSLTMAELLARARGGDQTALGLLFHLSRNYLRIVARARVHDWLQAKVDASDLVQQTLLEAHRDFERFRGATPAEWLAWLRRSLEHNAADSVRRYQGTDKRKTGKEIPLSPADSALSHAGIDPADQHDSPSQVLLSKERELLVSDALSYLSADHQEVIVLRNLQRLPFDEIAQRMNRSRPAVQMLWMRAVRCLQDRLQDASGVR